MRERGPSLDAWIPAGGGGGGGGSGGGSAGWSARLGDPVVAPRPRPRPGAPCPECLRRGVRIEQLEEMLSCFQASTAGPPDTDYGAAERRVEELEEELDRAHRRNAELEQELKSYQGHIAQTNAALRSLHSRGVLPAAMAGLSQDVGEAPETIAVQDVVQLKEKAMRVLRQIQSQVFDLSGKLEPTTSTKPLPTAAAREQGTQAEAGSSGEAGEGEKGLSEFFT